MNNSIEELKNALEQEKRSKEKLEKTYIRKIKKIEKSLLLCEKTRDNYSVFYLKSIESLQEKQTILDQRNQELSDIKNSLSEQNTILKNNQKELESLNKKLNISAFVDGLTQLSNRKSFDETMKSMTEHKLIVFSLFFIDLDGFKAINDTFGHDAGDHLLQTISLRLLSASRDKDQVFRLGGDEFVIIIQNEISEDLLKTIARRILQQCSQEVTFGHLHFHVSASIGIARYPIDHQSDNSDNHLTQIRKFADAALYRAKNLGKNQYYFFNSDFSKEESNKNRIRDSIRQAIEDETISVYFQTQFGTPKPLNKPHNLSEKNKVGCFTTIGSEALLRWNNEFGLNTEEVINWTDKLNITKDIDILMLKKVCQILQKNPTILTKIPYIAVNFCSDTFSSSYHIKKAIELIQHYSINPNFIMIELTERAFLGKNKTTQNNINTLEKHGFKLGLDDFGTGYSSLECLNRINFDVLKIDKSFSKEINKDTFNKIVVDHVSAFAMDLGIDVIVEGVETEQQLHFLQTLGIHQFQGFYFSRPVPQSEFVKQFSNTACNQQKKLPI